MIDFIGGVLLILATVALVMYLKALSNFKKICKAFESIGKNMPSISRKRGIERMREIHQAVNTLESKKLMTDAENITASYVKSFRLFVAVMFAGLLYSSFS